MQKRWGITSRAGFTIVELIIVITVIAILSLIVVVSYQAFVGDAEKTALRNEVKGTASEIDLYIADNDRLPLTLDVLNDGGGPKAADRHTIGYSRFVSTGEYCVQLYPTGRSDLVTKFESESGVITEGECSPGDPAP